MGYFGFLVAENFIAPDEIEGEIFATWVIQAEGFFGMP